LEAKTLSYITLVHKEIKAMNQSSGTSSSSQLISGVNPSKLNIKKGLVEHGSNAEEQKRGDSRQPKKTWKKGKKRFSSDPLVSSGKYHIGQTGYGYVKKVDNKEWKSSEERKK
jgi:hypothetical protein